MDNNRKLTIIRTLDAPIEKVWRAWIDPAELAKWWGPRGVTNPECKVDARVGGTISVVMLAGEALGELAGQRWPMRGIFQEVQVPAKLVFTNQAIDEAGNVLIDGLTSVTLEAQNGKTKLTMTTTAKGVAPQASQMLDGMEAGWNQSLDKLAENLNQEVGDNPKTHFEVDRENLEVRITRVFEATPERLWQAYTDSKQVECWWEGTSVDKLDVRVGGVWRFVSGENGEHSFRGEFKEVDEPYKLVRTFEYEPYPGHISVESATFEPQPGGTTLLTQVSKFKNLDDLNSMVGSGMERGAVAGIERLARVVES